MFPASAGMNRWRANMFAVIFTVGLVFVGILVAGPFGAAAVLLGLAISWLLGAILKI